MRGGQDQALREGVEPAPPRAAEPTGAPGRPANARGGARAPGLAESGGARPSRSEPRSPGDSGPPVRTEVPGIQQQERDAAAPHIRGERRAASSADAAAPSRRSRPLLTTRPTGEKLHAKSRINKALGSTFILGKKTQEVRSLRDGYSRPSNCISHFLQKVILIA